MRVKQLWQVVPLPQKLRLVWERFTFSRLTTAYFVFSVVHCILQVALQSWAFRINADAASFLYSLAFAGDAVDDRIPAYGDDGGLALCSDVPAPGANCTVIWSPEKDRSPTNLGADEVPGPLSTLVVSLPSSLLSSSTASLPTVSTTSTSARISSTSTSPESSSTTPVPLSSVTSSSAVASPTPTPAPADINNAALLEAESDDELEDGIESDSESESEFGEESDDEDEVAPAPAPAGLRKRRPPIVSTTFEDEDGVVKVNVTGVGIEEATTLSKDCLWSLSWPVEKLDDTKREDIVFIAFQFWVLGMSFVALLNESIPHIFASLLTHLLATGWSIFQVLHTADFRSSFNKTVTFGTCRGVSLLPTYWNERARAEYPTLALNCLSLFISAFLTWRLFKLFGWQTFKRVGASLVINRIYKLVLVLSITIQLSLFFMAVTVALWLDSLFNGIAAQVAWYVPLYKASSIATLVLLIPWLVTGWFAVRKELRLPMFIFLVLSILYLAGWSVMFLSTTFRWMFISWRFFSIMASVSVFLTVCAFILGVICRYNFGKGLSRYLHAHENLPGDDFAPVYRAGDSEKVAFPTNPVPTFSAAFGKGAEVPPPSQMFPARMGPRFFRSSREPFETPSTQSIVTLPPAALSSSDRYSADQSNVTVTRSDSSRSKGSLTSHYTYEPSDWSHSRSNSSENTGRTMQGKRWVIE